MNSISYLFEPESVAVIGASDDPTKYGNRVMQSIIDAGYEWPIYPVNPNVPEVLGRKAFPRMQDIPEPVEHVILKSLAKKPDHRYDTCGEFAGALEDAVSEMELPYRKLTDAPAATEMMDVPAAPTGLSPS